MTNNVKELQLENKRLFDSIYKINGIASSIALIDAALVTSINARMEDAPFHLNVDSASRYHAANVIAYRDVLAAICEQREQISSKDFVQSIVETDNLDILEDTNQKLIQIFTGLSSGLGSMEIFLSCSKRASIKEIPTTEYGSPNPVYLTGKKSALWHLTKAEAYQYALEMLEIPADILNLVAARTENGPFIKPYTVVTFGSDNQQIVCHHVTARDSNHAFAEAAKIDGCLEMVVALEGHQSEGDGIAFPGQYLVDSDTILSRPEFSLDDAIVSEPVVASRPKFR